MMKNSIWILTVCVALGTLSCSDFLDIKPDKKLAVPTTSDDLRALLNYVATVNHSFAAGLGEVGSDNFYVTDSDWEAIPDELERNSYVWASTPVALGYWVVPYNRILTANTVLELSGEVEYNTEELKNETEGTAYFTRGLSFYDLSQVFSPPYDNRIADERLGIPIRLSSDVNAPSAKSSLAELYGQIISDLQKASHLLHPVKRQYPTQPSKAAAYAALSRVYLAKRDYDLAGFYADSCLQLYSQLMDYNELEEIKPYIVDKFNEEVIYYAEIRGNSYLNDSRATVDSALYRSFDDEDIRKQLYFRTNVRNDGVNFVGDFSQNTGSAKFCGMTTAEVVLTRMECLIRTGDTQEAVTLLRRFLEHRYRTGSVPAVDQHNSEELLAMVLLERRKELMFRGLRWSDIRRLSFDAAHEVHLRRNLAGKYYELTPLEQRTFAYGLPQEVLERSDL